MSVNTLAKVNIRRVISTTPEKVFDAWTDPSALVRWWRASPAHETTVCEVDLRVGGHYRLGMRTPEGNEHIVGGEYRSVTRPSELVFTWRWEHSEEDYPTTLVTVRIRPHDLGSELVLMHERFPDDEQAALHNGGWTGCLDHLVTVLEH